MKKKKKKKKKANRQGSAPTQTRAGWV